MRRIVKKSTRVVREQSKTPKTTQESNQDDKIYDIVLSFAGEDRAYVEAVAEFLQKRGIIVFYDKYEEVDLWGKDLAVHLGEIYGKKGKYCIPFISKAYAVKTYPTYELQNALSKAIMQKGEYILPARFDTTEIPGLRSTIVYIDLANKTPEQFGSLIIQKLEKKSTSSSQIPIEIDELSEKSNTRQPKKRSETATKLDPDQLLVIKNFIIKEFLEISPESMRLKLKSYNLNEEQTNLILENILSNIDALHSLSGKIFSYLSMLYPKNYENIWRQQDNSDLFFAILKDGPINETWISDVKSNRWTSNFNRLKSDIQSTFGFTNELMNYVWDTFLKGKIKFVKDSFSTEDPVEFDSHLTALEKNDYHPPITINIQTPREGFSRKALKPIKRIPKYDMVLLLIDLVVFILVLVFTIPSAIEASQNLDCGLTANSELCFTTWGWIPLVMCVEVFSYVVILVHRDWSKYFAFFVYVVTLITGIKWVQSFYPFQISEFIGIAVLQAISLLLWAIWIGLNIMGLSQILKLTNSRSHRRW